ncbi:16S rRNA (adenine(1518)-N(6)/adenine(1519)-N(6))-dimethyltransferase RsmA [Candidatus Nomurabacteria bacterium]|nr:16S rRNA (adenine(1518)-N(6)/adenine(1519)-N(6))-dimethyltransferase RsmA [Candidatus Nomurabacteria bacterium]
MKIHKAKKSLGQNFLKSEPALKAIINAGEIKSDDVILEIGPGKGALTKKLLEHAGTVIAIEKDRELFALLQEKFAEEIKNKKLILIQEDILEIKTQSLFERTLGRSDGDGQRKFSTENFRGESKKTLRLYKIIANIPYNITGAILKKFLTEENQPEKMVLMVQHEVAKRIVARDGSESILSISVKAYGDPKIVMKVPARYFSPAPKVDSAIIAINNISRKNFNSTQEEEKFWEIVKTGFAHKRKKLSGNLKSLIKLTDEKWKNIRAEELKLSDWLELSKN